MKKYKLAIDLIEESAAYSTTDATFFRLSGILTVAIMDANLSADDFQAVSKRIDDLQEKLLEVKAC